MNSFLFQFGGEFQHLCCEILGKCLELDRFQLDSAKVRRDVEETDAAADRLANSCRLLAVIFEDHLQMLLVNKIFLQVKYSVCLLYK